MLNEEQPRVEKCFTTSVTWESNFSTSCMRERTVWFNQDNHIQNKVLDGTRIPYSFSVIYSQNIRTHNRSIHNTLILLKYIWPHKMIRKLSALIEHIGDKKYNVHWYLFRFLSNVIQIFWNQIISDNGGGGVGQKGPKSDYLILEQSLKILILKI